MRVLVWTGVALLGGCGALLRFVIDGLSHLYAKAGTEGYPKREEIDAAKGRLWDAVGLLRDAMSGTGFSAELTGRFTDCFAADPMREFLEKIAPMNHVKDLKKPIFIVAGANDPRVPQSEADQMAAALQRQGTPVWYLVGKDEGHGFAKKKNADFQFYATILFVEKYLLGAGGG